MTSAVDRSRNAISKLPGLFFVCTCSRRPGLSSILTSAAVYSKMDKNENDEVLKKFTYNLLDTIKKNIQDDGVCFVIIPPGELNFNLSGANAGGPIILRGSNKNYVFTYAIIR
jgi:hypothetical protein